MERRPPSPRRLREVVRIISKVDNNLGDRIRVMIQKRSHIAAEPRRDEELLAGAVKL